MTSRPAEFADASRGTRLQKVLAEAAVASRRACEALIAEGRVTVNGKRVTTLPAWVDPQRDRIEVDGRRITPPAAGHRRRTASARKVYIMLHKPRRVVSTSRDPQGRTTVLDLVDLPPRIAGRLFAVGRLDADSTGLILLTNDGELANRLMHPRYGVPRQYRVSVRGRLDDEDVKKLRRGLYLGRPGGAARRAAMASVRVLSHQRDRTRGDRTTIMVTLREGRNREIRRLLARLGHKVRRLERVAIGPLKLKALAPGQWRMLSAAEVKRLRACAVVPPEKEHG